MAAAHFNENDQNRNMVALVSQKCASLVELNIVNCISLCWLWVTAWTNLFNQNAQRPMTCAKWNY